MLNHRQWAFKSFACFGAAALGAGALLAGCNKAGTPNGAPQASPAQADASPVEAAPAPAPVAPPVDFTAITGKINASEDMFAWFDARAEYLAGDERSAEVDAALAAKEAELLAKSPAKPVNDALDLVALKWELDGEGSSEGKLENFVVTWLFHKKADIALTPGHELRLVLRGWLDKAHQHYLEAAGQKETRFFELTYSPKPTVESWESGSYELIAKKTYVQLPNVPYRLHSFFSEMEKTEDGSLKFVGPYGTPVEMGWFADLGQ